MLRQLHRFESMEEAMMAIDVITEEEKRTAKEIRKAEEEVKSNQASKRKSDGALQVRTAFSSAIVQKHVV